MDISFHDLPAKYRPTVDEIGALRTFLLPHIGRTTTEEALRVWAAVGCLLLAKIGERTHAGTPHDGRQSNGIAVTSHLSPEDHERLQDIADESERSLTYLVNRAVREFIARRGVR